MNAQLIEKNGQPEWAVVPYDAYLQLLEDAEMLADIRDYDEAQARWAAGEELVPSKVTFAIMDGANPLQVWRTQRGLTQQALAERAGITASYLSQLENGQRTGTAVVLQALATALDLTLDDILPVAQESTAFN